MTSKNEKAVLASYEAFNAHDLAGSVRPLSEDCAWTEHPTGTTYKGREEIKGWFAGFFAAFSDLKISDVKTFDPGEALIATFVLTGTNDGPLGPLPATSRRATIPVCDIFHVDDKGNVIAGETYYDQLSLLIQLGHAQAPPA